MGEAVMAMSKEQKDAIASVVVDFMEKHIKDFIPPQTREAQPLSQALYIRELDLVERVTRVEEELKSQRELMINRFEAMDNRFLEMQTSMDKRFEQVDKRFEDMQKYMDKRFSVLQWTIGLGFTAILLVTTLLKFLA